MWEQFEKFLADERGATAIEYALVATGIFIPLVAVISQLGTNLNTSFHSVKTGFE